MCDCKNPFKYLAGIGGLFFFGMGIGMFMGGCDPNVAGTCPNYYNIEGDVVGYKVDAITCSDCVQPHQSCGRCGNDDDSHGVRSVCLLHMLQ